MREMKLGFAYSVIAICILLIAGCVLLKQSLIYGFATGLVISGSLFCYLGYRPRSLLSMIRKGLLECKQLYVLILLIGITVSIWIASGVVPSMMYYGFEYLKDMNFLLAAFLIAASCSLFMGTAVGTVSTIGIAILGIGRGLGMPTPVLLGAIVSGAFIADKISPISGLLNLTISTCKTDYKTALTSMLKTLIPTIAITASIYYLLGIRYGVGVDEGVISELQRGLQSGFYISAWLLLMPLIIVLMSSLGVKIFYSILAGLTGGAAISIFVQHLSLGELIKSIAIGYEASTASTQLNRLLVSGGVRSMLEVLLMVMGAVALSSLLEGTGVINRISGKAIEAIQNKGGLILNTAAISSVLTTVTCDQTMGIVLPGRLLRDKYDQLGLNRGVLARTISDTGTIIAPLMPWNVNSLIISVIVGSSISYAQYAVLCYIAPILTIFIGWYYKK